MITFSTPNGIPMPFDPATMLTGYLPMFLDENDLRPAREQIDTNYRHGGGWQPQPKWELTNRTRMTMKYPGDPPMQPIAIANLRHEQLFLYPHAYLCILQPDGSFEMGHVD